MRKPSLLALAGLAFSAAATGASTPSPPDAIVRAAVDCWEAASGPALDEAQLQSRGWKQGIMQSPDGKPIAKAPRFYGKAQSGVMLMVMDTPGASGCAVVSAVSKKEDVSETANLLMTRLKAIDPNVKGGRKDQAIIYISGSRVGELVATGSPERPGTRIIIAHTSAEKK